MGSEIENYRVNKENRELKPCKEYSVCNDNFYNTHTVSKSHPIQIRMIIYVPQLRLEKTCVWKINRYMLIYTRGGNESR